MNEAAALELPPCPTEYEPPPLSEGPPPYEDVVERPAELPDTAEQNGILSTHGAVCREGGTALRALPECGRIEAGPHGDGFRATIEGPS